MLIGTCAMMTCARHILKKACCFLPNAYQCFTVMVSGPCVNTLQTPITFRFLAVCDTVSDFDSPTIKEMIHIDVRMT